MSLTKTDRAWGILFERYQIVRKVEEHGYFVIAAKQIREEREPRLMAKFDHYSNLPQIFRENQLAILPVSRSSYIIGPFEVYHKVNYLENAKPKAIDFPREITTIDPTNIYSESAALHCAYLTGMIDDLMNEQMRHTISGRMSSKEFSFEIKSHNARSQTIGVTNSQVEIDGGYEGPTQFIVVEAKNETVDDILVRQLYYPYRLWQKRTSKIVRPVFFTYSNDIFSFFLYEFTDPTNYNSLQLLKQKNYIIAHERISHDDINGIMRSVTTIEEPAIPFPQADSFPRVIDLLGLLVENDLTKQEITSNYNFDERQSSYYTAAGIYLGLIDKYQDEQRQVLFTLTEKGYTIMHLPTREKFLALVEAVLSHQVFHRVLIEYFKKESMPKKEDVVRMMEASDLYQVKAESTYKRRASTIMGWINWIVRLPDMYANERD
ncbi:type II restriction enzyme [Alkalihalobacillus pseudalcaliphilus]|uniref:type II restriction enzyme n=1 Tax=Alkalihalobacillus pseudalcaliphilus TaxID=79884 RepID=UPI00064DD7CD|nr:hypothetical protein [Alkalihalobacillus pseudalcaliphilus]KMK76726.1 translation elongation factor [Alkalihalobacillus pseudalcaliphilus]